MSHCCIYLTDRNVFTLSGIHNYVCYTDISLQMAFETPPAGRGRGGGRGAPFGNSEPKRELRRPLAAAPVNSTPDTLAQQIQNIDLKKSFNINAQEFVPT